MGRSVLLLSRALTGEGRFNEARLLLEEAVELDPDFALGHMLLGDILQTRDERRAYEHWARALDASRKRKLTQREALRIRGVYAFNVGDYDGAAGAFRVYALRYPDDPEPLYREGWTLREMGRHEQALSRFRAAHELAPDDAGPIAQIATTLMRAGRFDEAREWVARLRDAESPEGADKREALIDYLTGFYGDALARLEGLTRSPHLLYESYGYLWTAWLLQERGRYAAALETIEKGTAVDRKNGQSQSQAAKELLRAYVLHRRSEREAGRTACLKALELNGGAYVSSFAGTLLARMGFLEDARAVAAELEAYPHLPVFAVAENVIAGEVLLFEGRIEESLERFRAASALEPGGSYPSYLTRALVLAGELEEAMKTYSEPAVGPRYSQLWRYLLDAEFPDLYADDLFLYGKIAFARGRYDLSRDALTRYLDIRSAADPGLTDVTEARGLLAMMDRGVSRESARGGGVK